MTKFRMIGAAAVLSSVLAGPATAKQVIAHPVHQAESTYCATIEPGNPYSPVYDYEAWSAWGVVGIVAAMMLAPVIPCFREEVPSSRTIEEAKKNSASALAKG